MFIQDKITAYLDDYDMIKIYSNIKIKTFYINMNNKIIELKAVEENKKNNYTYTINIDLDLELTKCYDLFLDNKIYKLEKRKIVLTKRFETETYNDQKLGFNYKNNKTIFKLWAPIAEQVLLKVNLNGKDEIYNMKHNKSIYSIEVNGNLDQAEYSYIVSVNNEIKEVIDPYAISSTANGKKSVVVNINNLKSNAKFISSNLDETYIYECSVADFTSSTIHDFKNPGKFIGFCESNKVNKYGDSIGFDYVKKLKPTHIQMMPMYDFGSVNELLQNDSNYNWGYDPVQYNVYDGSYLVNDTPDNRIKEPILMIDEIKKNNIGVVMDIVYNHVYDAKTFSFNTITPGYFFRMDDDYNYSNASFCGNEVASERLMVRKFIVDSLTYLVDTFKLDGLRIDLMGIMDIETLLIIQKKLKSINPDILINGEGWKMPTLIDESLCATQFNADKMTGIGFFNDDFRDFVKGHNSNFKTKGYVQGNFDNTKLEKILDGQSINIEKKYISSDQYVNYLSCHDDHTLYDRLKMNCKDDDIIKAQIELAYLILFRAPGIKFIHCGCEFMRTKSGKKNTYNDLRSVNAVNWDLVSENKELVNNIIKMRLAK